MKNSKTIQLIFALLFLSSVAFAQDKEGKGKGRKKENYSFRLKQHVMITLRDGTEVEGVIHSHISRNKYWVRQYHTGRQGQVKAKFMRPLSDAEIDGLKNKK